MRGIVAMSSSASPACRDRRSAFFISWRRPWRGRRDQLRPRPQPQAKLQHVPGRLAHSSTLPISSHQAAANCGPRRLSGSSEENIIAVMPVCPDHPPPRCFKPRLSPRAPSCQYAAPALRSSHRAHRPAFRRSAQSVRSVSLANGRKAAGHAIDPFGPRAGLARAAPADHQPDINLLQPHHFGRHLPHPPLCDPFRPAQRREPDRPRSDPSRLRLQSALPATRPGSLRVRSIVQQCIAPVCLRVHPRACLSVPKLLLSFRCRLSRPPSAKPSEPSCPGFSQTIWPCSPWLPAA